MATASGLQTRAAPALNNAGGIALAGPIPRNDLAVDPMAGFGIAQHLSSCGTFPAYAQTSDGSFAPDPEDALGLRNTDVSAFQNPFLLGETFRRQLSVMAALSTGQSDQQDLNHFAQVGAAEVKKWAGPGSFLTSGSADLRTQDVYLVNIGPADLGTVVSANHQNELNDIENRLVLVSSDNAPAAAANCAAGLRQSCAGISSTIREAVPGAASDVLLSDSHALGLDRAPIKLQFDPPSVITAPGSFLVLRPSVGKKGKVLAWLKGGASSDWYAESYSDEQRALAQKIFGVDLTPDVVRSCTNEAPVTLPSGYCIQGMKRDQFVPLANELNSTGTSASIDDSWKNYLDFADAAATKSDQLGEQLIQQGLAQDVRKESAAEELGNLCGSYLSVDDVTAVNGQINPPEGDQSLAECLDAPSTDIVFLRDDPFANYTASAADTAIRSAYCQSPVQTTDPPFCSRKTILKHAGLNFHTSTTKQQDADIGKACADIKDTMSPAISAGVVPSQVMKAPFGNAIATSWASASGIAGALQGLKLVEQADGQWLLKTGSRVVTGSNAMVDDAFTGGALGSNHDVWPRCVGLTAGAGQPKCSAIADFVATMFPAELATNDPIHAGLRSAVEGTVFYMGALAGGLPANTIRMPVPVANRRSPALQQQRIIPQAALYSVSYFERNGSETANDPLALGPGLKPLYTISPKDGSGDNGYFGKIPWSNDEVTKMGGLARPFVSDREKEYLTERRDSDTSVWSHDLYQQALDTFYDQGYLYVDTWNAALAFDDSLSASATAAQHVNRDNLQAWLIDRANEFNSNGPDFVAHVVEASYLSSPGKTDASTNPPQAGGNAQPAAPAPYQFCHTAKAVPGRSVCPGAKVSPVFHLFDGQAIDQSGCDPNEYLAVPLSSTVNVQSRDVCDGHYSTSTRSNGTDYTVSRIGQSCSGSCTVGDTNCVVTSTLSQQGTPFAVSLRNIPTGDGWVSPDEAAGDSPQGKGYQWQTGPTNICPASSLVTLPETTFDTDTSCPVFDWHSPWGSDTSRSLWQDRLKPSVCPPSERLELFLDNHLNQFLGVAPPPDDLTKRVTAMQTLVRALGVSCMSANQNLGVHLADKLPSIRTADDINVLGSWVDRLGLTIDKIGDVFYLVDVPEEVVSIAQAHQSDPGAVSKGERGKTLLELESKLSQLENNFSTLGSTLQQVSSAIDKARLELEGIQLSTNGQNLGIAASRIENDRQRGLAYLQGLKGIAEAVIAVQTAPSIGSIWDNGAGAAKEAVEAADNLASSGINIEASHLSDENLDDRATNIDMMGENSEAQVVLGLSQVTSGLYQTINDTITALKTNSNDALIAIDGLKQTSAQANIALAKASGADFVSVNGQQRRCQKFRVRGGIRSRRQPSRKIDHELV